MSSSPYPPGSPEHGDPREPPPRGERQRAVVCLSGGMDSSVCAVLAARDYQAYALHFSYGQRTESRELQAARAVAEAVGIEEFLPLRMDLFRSIGGSALTDLSINVPRAARLAASKPGEEELPAQSGWADGAHSRPGSGIPVTYVPFRNAHFLSAAVSWAEVLGASAIFIGAVEQDSSGYPDCRQAYYEAFQQLIRMGTREGSIRVETPLIRMRKSAIVRLGLELSAPFHLTWSCYTGEAVACGICDSCVLRLRAFEQAGQRDPIPYATGTLN